MAHFEKDFFKFFKELTVNNNKEWFDANRSRYHKSVKEPFDKYVADLIDAIHKVDKNVDIAPKDAIFRINRDIRFSKDKTPYKLNRSAIISPKGRKDKAYPGLYVEISPEHCRVYGGVHSPDKDQLHNIRQTITQNPKKLEELMNEPSFQKTFGEIRGEKNKVIPKEFKTAATEFDLIFNKQFYWFTNFNFGEALKEDFLIKTMEAYTANRKVMDYFTDAMK